MLSRTVPILVILLLSMSACATGFSAAGVSPVEIPDLEQTVADEPTNAGAWTRLGIAYGMAERPDDAREALERAVALPDAPTAAWAHLGTWREEADDLEGAADAYRTYLESGGNATDAVDARLLVIERELMRRRARQALEMESALTDVPPDPMTVGVLPLEVQGPEEYQALGVGLAELLTTDLSITDRLEVVERAQLNALVEEMKLAFGGFTDEASAARAGRLMRAGRLVQGNVAVTVDGDRVRVNTLVLNAASAASSGQAEEAGPLDALMELEIQLALQIYRELGVELTASERALLEEKPTRNLQAFLAYSEGLQLLDQGAYEAAAQRFEAATALDPDFSAARIAARRAQGVAQTSPDAVSEAASLDIAPLPTDGAGSATENAVEQMANATVPAGVSTTSTGESSGSTPGQTATAETTETTAGTGVGKVVRIPIVLVRPRPYTVYWWIR